MDSSFSAPTTIVSAIDGNVSNNNKPLKPPKPLKKGFLNSASSLPPKKSNKKQNIPFLKANPKQETDIPDFLRVLTPMDQYKEELTSMLKPTQELVAEVIENDGIKSGLEDPEVMAAVQEIACNPSAIEKYKNNAKVTSFYSHLGQLMGDKIEKQSRDAKTRNKKN